MAVNCRLISRAVRTALSASSSFSIGAPKTAMSPSPIYLSRVPPWLKTISVIREKYRFKIILISRGGIVSERRVKPTMSAKRMVAMSSLDSMISSIVSSPPLRIISMTWGEWKRCSLFRIRSSSRIRSFRADCSMTMAAWLPMALRSSRSSWLNWLSIRTLSNCITPIILSSRQRGTHMADLICCIITLLAPSNRESVMALDVRRATLPLMTLSIRVRLAFISRLDFPCSVLCLTTTGMRLSPSEPPARTKNP